MYNACARAVFCNEENGAALNVLDCSLVSLLEPSLGLLKLSVDCIRSLQSLNTDPSCINYQPIRPLATVQLIHLLNVLSFFLPCNECKSNIHSISSGFGLHQLQELLDDLLCCIRVAERHLKYRNRGAFFSSAIQYIHPGSGSPSVRLFSISVVALFVILLFNSPECRPVMNFLP